MKKVKMIVTSVVVLAIVGSAFAFNAKKIGKFCVTTSTGTADVGCYTINNFKRTTGAGTPLLYKVDWDGATCTTGSGCSTSANFITD